MFKFKTSLLVVLLTALFSTACASKKDDKTGELLVLLGLTGFFDQKEECPASPDAKVSLKHCTAEATKWEKVPKNIQFSSIASAFTSKSRNLEQLRAGITGRALPTSVDLWEGVTANGATKKFFPAVGNQGQYGTCVAWAVGYGTKSFLEAIDQVWEPGTDTSKQFSPRYLFTSIPDNQKGANCGGTGFEPALESMMTNGIPTEATVPYNKVV